MLSDSVAALAPAWKRETIMHRKFWEWAFITTALDERQMLVQNKRGLGFGVGVEPLTAYFASRGCAVLATDQLEGGAWTTSGQHADGRGDLNRDALCDPATFEANVWFAPLDMSDIPAHLGEWDFIWSSCAFEHLGSLGAGARFVAESANMLAPGGVAIHTTEFNVSSDDQTVTSGPVVLYRECDLVDLAIDLAHKGFEITLDLAIEDGWPNDHVAIEPTDLPHLRYLVEGFVTTSVGLIIEKRSYQE